MAEAAGVSASEYERLETGEYDFSFTFLFKCASKLGMDISELVSGSDPKLSFYNITRAGEGMPIRRRAGFNYRHLAPLLKNRMAEPSWCSVNSQALIEATVHNLGVSVLPQLVLRRIPYRAAIRPLFSRLS